jgi:phosphatidylserine/phosphatidylglycerophosphate/cardiolipin synthase-like enzyme
MRFSLLALLIFSIFSAPARAEKIKYIVLPDQALAAFTSLVQSAKRSIDIATFIFEPCHASTQVIMETLAAKAKAGVRVRLLLDAVTQPTKSKGNLAAFARKYGIELKWYNRALIHNPGENHRSHVKLMVIDDDSFITGGRNFADEYFGMAEYPNFADRDLMVQGDAARQAARSFDELWESSMGSRPLSRRNDFSSWNAACGTNETAHVNTVKKFLRNARAILGKVPTRTCGRVTFLTDAPDFLSAKYSAQYERGGPMPPFMSPMRMKRKRVTSTILQFLAGVRSRLDMENWCYMPTELLRSAFAKLRARSIPINVITNEDMDGPGVIKYAEEYINNKNVERDITGSEAILQVSRHGSLDNSYALSPKNASFRLHGKVFVRDNEDVIVSSFNIDPRSYHTNLESMVMVENCPSLASDVKAEMRNLAKVYKNDIESGRLAPPRKAGLFGRLVGILGFNLL